MGEWTTEDCWNLVCDCCAQDLLRTKVLLWGLEKLLPGEGKKEELCRLKRDVQEWYLPSWKVEPKYSTKVLIGNWLEERKKFIREERKPSKSIYTRDYVRFPEEVPDRTVMRRIKKKIDGLPKKYILTHHEEPSHRNLVTQYDDQYIRHGYNPVLPPLRKWNRHKMAWVPEKSDFPIVEPPTNYGLFEHLVKKWKRQEPDVMNSVYNVSYTKPPISAYTERQRPNTTRILKASQAQWLPSTLERCG